MMVAQQNAKGGVLGRPLKAVVVDSAAEWPLFAEKAHRLLTVMNVDVVVGAWVSVSRKSLAGAGGTERADGLSGAIRGRGILEERHLLSAPHRTSRRSRRSKT
nr:transporter substrate-binding protein [Paracoccus alcaliphilus]